MEYIVEFEPDQLIIIQDFDDVPDEYKKLLKKFLSKQYGIKGKLTGDAWDWGTEIRIIHWEWSYLLDNKKHHELIIDITGFPAGGEHGVICCNNNLIFENNHQVLTPLVTKHALLIRQQAFERVRKLSTEDPHPHMDTVLKAIEELKGDLEEVSVDEEEYKDIVQGPFVHYSSDDASSLSSDEDE